ncbi:MAG: cation diffusion facilitator family transporter [Candidatus Gracilibacteria bacterium]
MTHQHHTSHHHEYGDIHENHDHSHGVSNLSSAFLLAITLNIAFVIVEAFFGVKIHSLALLSDASHNVMDILNLLLSGFALWLSQRKSTERFTYGYKRASIFSALINSILIIITAIYLVFEAIGRMMQPVETVGTTMMIVAGIGILVNGFSGLILMKAGKEDINIKSAYMHLLMDALVSLGVVFAGALIYFTGYTVIDPIISIVVSIVMLVSVMNLLKQSIRMNFDGVPHGIDTEDIRIKLLKIEGVQDIHHIHIWSLSTTKNAFTAHITLGKGEDEQTIKTQIRHILEDENIHHTTLETEYGECGNHIC